MLTHVHKPSVEHIRTHVSSGDCPTFHTVQIKDTVTGGAVALFIASDWSQWDAIAAQVTEYRHGETLRTAGAAAGKAAASWVFDGNTTREAAQAVIDGYDAGDPAVMQLQPSPLSGEWSDEVSPMGVLAMIGVDEEDDSASQWLDEYETAFIDAWWEEVLRVAAIHAAPDEDDDRVTVSVAGEESRVWFGTAQAIEKIISEAAAGGETDD